MLPKGKQAEEVVKDYLISQGLTWLSSQYRCRFGEIDLIMRDQLYVVFVEVRFRQNRHFGNALESITQQKQKKILLTASFYLTEKRLHSQAMVRFDVACIQGDTNQIEWIKDAFR